MSQSVNQYNDNVFAFLPRLTGVTVNNSFVTIFVG